ncbi:MAG: RNA 3'-terminal phosphate cyclase [candidate division WOR-3 bacterium]
MLEIDGSFGAGGGQLLRTALALSAILKTGFVIKNIRARRPRPGLMPQHLACVRAAARLCRARVQGDVLGSTELIFEPDRIESVKLTVDVAAETGSAGAVTLVVQTVLPIMLFAPEPGVAVLRGGTHVPFSPVYEYLERVLLPFIQRLGYQAEVQLNRFGFFPVGGGEMVLKTQPAFKSQLAGIKLTEPGRLIGLKVVSAVSRLPLNIARRQAARLKQRLLVQPEQETVQVVPAACPGTYLFLEADYEQIAAGFSALGRKGKPAEEVADEVYTLFYQHHQSGCAVDPNLADQSLLFLIFTPGQFLFSTSRVTEHLRSGSWIINRFIPERRIELRENSDGTGVVKGE